MIDPDGIAEAEQVFAPAAIAEITAEFWKIRSERKRLERIEVSLKEVLRKEIGRTGEAIEIEGIPALRLIPVTHPYYDLTGLSDLDWVKMIGWNEAMLRSGEDGFIRIHDGSLKKARAHGLDVELKAIRGRRTSQLRFDEEEF